MVGLLKNVEEVLMPKTNIPEKGAIVQRDMVTFLIHPHIPGGFVDPKMLRKIADVAEKYGAKYVKLTGAQRIAIIGLQEKDLDNVWEAFEDRQKAIGLSIRSFQIYPGTRSCKKAKQDSPVSGLFFRLVMNPESSREPAGSYGKPTRRFNHGIDCAPPVQKIGFLVVVASSG
jgi:NAD(P)H-nitrite reductase large subunit